MTKKHLKPPASKNNVKNIVEKILKEKRKVTGVSPLTPERDQKAFLCKLEKGERLVIKYATREEWENQKISSELGIQTPKVIGHFFEVEREKKKEGKKVINRGWYGQEYIEYEESRGKKTLAKLLQEGTIPPQAFNSAIRLLVDIHNTLDDFKGKKKSTLPILTKSVLKAQLQKRIDNRLLPLLKKFEEQKKYGKKIKRWKKTICSFNRKRVISLLGKEDNITVLVRWDYKPDNLLVRKDNGEISLFTVDWGFITVGSPWLDLGFLLADLDKKEREKYLKEYLELQKSKNSKWKDISFDDVKKRMKEAFALIQLIHASSNANAILNGKDTAYTHEKLCYHLDKLAEELY